MINTTATVVSHSSHYTQPILTIPKSIIGNILWLDAFDINGNGSSTTNGSSVTTWADKSGLGYNATANTSITYNASGMGTNYPALTFTNSQWLAGNIVNNNTTVSIFIIASINSTNQVSGRLISFGQNGFYDFNSTTAVGIIARQSFPRRITAARAGATYTDSTAGVSYSTPYLYEVWFDGTNYNSLIQVNNNTVISQASTGNFGMTYFKIGDDIKNDGQSLFNGFISEVLVYNTSLTTSDRNKVEGYLSWKWNLQGNLPSGHPYKSVAPVV